MQAFQAAWVIWTRLGGKGLETAAGQGFPGGIGELDTFGLEGLLLTAFSGAFEPTEATRVRNASMGGGQGFPGSIGELDAFGWEGCC